MDGLRELITSYQGEIELTGAVIITLVVAFFGFKLVVKMIAALGGGKYQDALKQFGYLAGVIIIGILGYSGLKALITKIAPTQSKLPGGR